MTEIVFHSCQTSLGFPRVYVDVIGLKLSLGAADATDPFDSSSLSMKSILYSAAHKNSSRLSKIYVYMYIKFYTSARGCEYPPNP